MVVPFRNVGSKELKLRILLPIPPFSFETIAWSDQGWSLMKTLFSSFLTLTESNELVG